MRRITAIIVLIAFHLTIILPTMVQARSNYSIYNLAILNIQAEGDLDQDDALLLTSELHRRLGEINFVQPISLAATKNILTKNRLTPDFCLNLNCALEAGQALGVDLIVYGLIHQVGNYFACDIRVVNVKSKKLIGVARYNIDGDLSTMLDQMKNVARKLVGLKTDPHMPLSRYRLTEVVAAKKEGRELAKTPPAQPSESVTEENPQYSVPVKIEKKDEGTDEEWSFLDDDDAFADSSPTASKNPVVPVKQEPMESQAENSNYDFLDLNTDDAVTAEAPVVIDQRNIEGRQTQKNEEKPTNERKSYGFDENDAYGQAEVLTPPKNSEGDSTDSEGKRSYKKWTAYGMLGAGLGAGVILTVKGLGKGNGGESGDPLPGPPVFVGQD